MNNINSTSSNMTASSILKNASTQAPKEESTNINTKDSVQLGNFTKGDYKKSFPLVPVAMGTGAVLGGAAVGYTYYNHGISTNEAIQNGTKTGEIRPPGMYAVSGAILGIMGGALAGVMAAMAIDHLT